mmetsp:Transcript_41259/g.68649  ORF Transcript_41259/g.68649 Transcript_41259/m.68649 type:complete len:564 (-) Transcript_41259:170-1861(-)
MDGNVPAGPLPSAAFVERRRSATQSHWSRVELEQLAQIRAGSAEMTPTWGRSLGLSLARPELQRSVRAGNVLRLWSTIFHHEPYEGLYEMSAPTSVIDTFVSHSWRTPGWSRALTLAWHLSLTRLVLVAAIVPLIWETFAIWFDIELTTWFLPQGSDGMIKIPIGAAPIVVPLVFAITMLSVGWCTASLYLDRCCMCQHDTELMRASIHQLGAYIARSKHFLILWDKTYCSRLWCMYEVASFLALHPVGHLHLVPITSVLPVLALWIFHTLATIGIAYVGAQIIFARWFMSLCQEYLPNPAAQVALLFVLASSILCVCYACVCWFVYDQVLTHMSAIEKLHQQLGSFAVANLQCAVEQDRAVVEKEIKRLFGSCQKFESVVRNQVAPQLVKDVGVLTIPYRFIILSVTSHIWFGIDCLSLMEWFSPDWWHMVVLFGGVVFSGDVLGMYAMSLIARSLHPIGKDDVSLDQSRWRKGIMASIVCYASFNGLLIAISSPNIPLFFSIPASVVFASFSYLLFRFNTSANRFNTSANSWRVAKASSVSRFVVDFLFDRSSAIDGPGLM